jgi:hypothetical protein
MIRNNILVCLQTRQGQIHYINWLTSSGIYYTLCNKAFQKKHRINTYAVGAPILDACLNCRATMKGQEDFHHSDGLIRNLLGSLLDNKVDKYKDLQAGLDTTQGKYHSLLTRRYSPSFRRMKNKNRWSIYEK